MTYQLQWVAALVAWDFHSCQSLKFTVKSAEAFQELQEMEQRTKTSGCTVRLFKTDTAAKSVKSCSRKSRIGPITIHRLTATTEHVTSVRRSLPTTQTSIDMSTCSIKRLKNSVATIKDVESALAKSRAWSIIKILILVSFMRWNMILISKTFSFHRREAIYVQSLQLSIGWQVNNRKA